jgi:hypothetical protein
MTQTYSQLTYQDKNTFVDSIERHVFPSEETKNSDLKKLVPEGNANSLAITQVSFHSVEPNEHHTSPPTTEPSSSIAALEMPLSVVHENSIILPQHLVCTQLHVEKIAPKDSTEILAQQPNSAIQNPTPPIALTEKRKLKLKSNRAKTIASFFDSESKSSDDVEEMQSSKKTNNTNAPIFDVQNTEKNDNNNDSLGAELNSDSPIKADRNENSNSAEIHSCSKDDASTSSLSLEAVGILRKAINIDFDSMLPEPPHRLARIRELKSYVVQCPGVPVKPGAKLRAENIGYVLKCSDDTPFTEKEQQECTVAQLKLEKTTLKQDSLIFRPYAELITDTKQRGYSVTFPTLCDYLDIYGPLLKEGATIPAMKPGKSNDMNHTVANLYSTTLINECGDEYKCIIPVLPNLLFRFLIKYDVLITDDKEEPCSKSNTTTAAKTTPITNINSAVYTITFSKNSLADLRVLANKIGIVQKKKKNEYSSSNDDDKLLNNSNTLTIPIEALSLHYGISLTETEPQSNNTVLERLHPKIRSIAHTHARLHTPISSSTVTASTIAKKPIGKNTPATTPHDKNSHKNLVYKLITTTQLKNK